MTRRSHRLPVPSARLRVAGLGLFAATTVTALVGTGCGSAAAPAASPSQSTSGTVAPKATTGATTPGARTTPDTAAAAARWLADQFNADGYIPTKPGAKTPDYSDTAQAVLALAATGSHAATAHHALGYLEAHVVAATTAKVGGKTITDPGSVAVLILDAHALQARPRDFGGSDLVTRLLATLQTTGAERGLFGTATPAYNGAYREGLSLAALAGAGGVTSSQVAPAVAWTERQQCPNGAWQAYRTTTSAPCPKSDPATYSGPDTNSTALAVEGLSAWKARTPHDALAWLESTQNSDGGWSYYGGSPSDADSTAVVVQALVALHAAHPTARAKKGRTPASLLARYQITSGSSAGALAFELGSSGKLVANLLATEQAVPAMQQLAFPF